MVIFSKCNTGHNDDLVEKVEVEEMALGSSHAQIALMQSEKMAAARSGPAAVGDLFVERQPLDARAAKPAGTWALEIGGGGGRAPLTDGVGNDGGPGGLDFAVGLTDEVVESTAA